MRRLLLLCAAMPLALLALTVSPAAARTPSAPVSAYCGFGLLDYSPLSRLTVTPSFARGDGEAAREPSSSDAAEEVPAKAQGKAGTGFSATVDVYFHIVTDGQLGAVSDADVGKQIQVLNMDFGGFEGGVDTGFRFALAGIDRTDNAAWFNAGPGTSDERDMKKALRLGDASDLNIYSTTAAAFLGVGVLPVDVQDPAVLRRHRDRLGVDVQDVEGLPGRVRPGEDGDARGRSLVRPLPHIPGWL
jgi:hypothetical protein